MTSLLDFEVEFPAQVDADFQAAYGESKWKQIKKALVLPPSHTSVRVNTMQTTRDQALQSLVQALEPFNDKLKSSGRPPVAPFCHTTLADVLVIPSSPAINAASSKSSAENESSDDGDQTALKPSSECLDVIVDRLCGEAVLRGSDIYVRGVMCASSGLESQQRVNIYVDLDHLTTRGRPIEDHKGRKVFIAQGTTQMSRGEFFRNDKGLAIDNITRVCCDAPPMNGLLAGDIYVQNLPSTVVAHTLNPQPGDFVLDMCAAPGGKSSHLATLMQDRGLLICCDRSKKKALELHKLFVQLNLENVVALKMDTTHSVVPKEVVVANADAPPTPLQVVAKARKQQQAMKNQPVLLPIEGFFPETFDKILLDPPCSALGLRPRLLHASDADELEQYASMQRNFLWAASFLVKPGGILVYSTCTINPAENERMVAYALQNFPLELIAPPTNWQVGSHGLANQGLSEDHRKMVQRFDPSEEYDTIGFFCAKFRKTSSMKTCNSAATPASDSAPSTETETTEDASATKKPKIVHE